MTSRSGRPYAGPNDLRRMEASLARAYRSTSLRVGDVAWLSRESSHRELSLYIRLWDDDAGNLDAWTYVRANGEFNVFIAPGSADATREAFIEHLLNVVDETAAASVAAGDPPVTLTTYCIDPTRSAEDRALATALLRRGFEIDSSPGGTLTRSLEQLPEPVVPPGYHLDWVQARAHLIGRVEAHRAAFAPSELTARKYERLQRAWSYRPTLDRVVLTDDDVVVAFCTAWLDEENASGLLEPVGTVPAHQRRGLASAVCTDALRALRDAGARIAQVGFATEAAHATYQSIGFARSCADIVLTRPIPK
jgi:predicted N-acetyltransferase YhbS